jgi:hypothetical protein
MWTVGCLAVTTMVERLPNAQGAALAELVARLTDRDLLTRLSDSERLEASRPACGWRPGRRRCGPGPSPLCIRRCSARCGPRRPTWPPTGWTRRPPCPAGRPSAPLRTAPRTTCNIDEAARAARRAGDPRTLDQLRADITIGWLTEGTHGTLIVRPGVTTTQPADSTLVLTRPQAPWSTSPWPPPPCSAWTRSRPPCTARPARCPSRPTRPATWPPTPGPGGGGCCSTRPPAPPPT